ncbi:hypothetical protein C2E23DRAFT_566572 [Lenzites betulinus]|nr:hypothetical protein C2E23DRAFT_566572 [Lenzites betulinus]
MPYGGRVGRRGCGRCSGLDGGASPRAGLDAAREARRYGIPVAHSIIHRGHPQQWHDRQDFPGHVDVEQANHTPMKKTMLRPYEATRLRARPCARLPAAINGPRVGTHGTPTADLHLSWNPIQSGQLSTTSTQPHRPHTTPTAGTLPQMSISLSRAHGHAPRKPQTANLNRQPQSLSHSAPHPASQPALALSSPESISPIQRNCPARPCPHAPARERKLALTYGAAHLPRPSPIQSLGA